ncbi:MAG: transcriptional repressor LexA [Chloroflexota bacterium]|nr:transcriptional repressor LexA [Chloroflexota bacterium]
MKRRSDKQERILDFLREFLARHDYPPSIRDIQTGCAISSTSVVDYNLKALEAKGLIQRDREVSRGIKLVGEERHGETAGTIRLPLLGTIAAGRPLPVPTDEGVDAAHADETITVTPDVLGGRRRENVYALRVQGTSMIDALIDDGDIVIMEPAETVDDGEMAAVWLKDANEVTLKKFYREGARVRLQPMNTTMAPIYHQADDVQVQGRVMGAIRAI